MQSIPSKYCFSYEVYMDLSNIDFVESYDSRYRKGYMEGWPKTRKVRIREYIESLCLPPQGIALDFGCGKGDFTAVIKQALPLWEVYGSDISSVGLEMAREKIRDCAFLTMEEIITKGLSFDLLFSHHVIEHVPDLTLVIDDFSKLVKENGHMVHILPTRCENTFEHWVAKSAINGIDGGLGNRYYYEHPGHLRRLSADEFSSYCLSHGFKLKRKSFSNRIFGTINWISCTDSAFLRNMFNLSRVNPLFHKALFGILQTFFLGITFLRAPAIEMSKVFAKRGKSKRKYFLFLLFVCMYPFSLVIDVSISFLAELEWRLYKKSGSEMYLFFIKGN